MPDADVAARPAKDYHVFVVYNDHDRAWVEGSLLVALRQASARVATRADIRLGEPDMEGLSRLVQQSAWQVIVASPAWHEDNFVQLIALLGSTHGFQTDTWPVIPVTLDGFTLPLWLSFRRGVEITDAASRRSAVDILCREILGQVEEEPPPPACPYPGMQPFDEADAEHFFGRAAEIEEATQWLRLNPRLAVIGPSGSGKSSLVHAGLLPRLRRDGRYIQRLRPGPAPLDTLRATAGNGSGDVLLVVDQLEELFTLGADQADAFCDEISTLATGPDHKIVVTLRADFYPQLMTSPLWPLFRDHRLELLPLGSDALRHAIVGPAVLKNVFVESALVERLVADAADEPGRLPLIQETLVLLWKWLEIRYLPLSAYDQLLSEATRLMTATSYGAPPRTGLHVALARHANSAMAQIPVEGRPLARRILLRLVQFGDGRADTRRPQPRDALLSEGDDPMMFDAVLRSLTSARLVTMTGTESAQTPIADLSHESLITAWPTFREWIEQRRVAEATRRRLQEKVAEWARLGHGSGGLLDDVELVEAERYIDSPDAADLGIGHDLRRLVAASRAALDEERSRRARSARRLRQFAGALALLLVVALALGALAFAQRNEAREQRDLARSGSLALQAVDRADGPLGAALLLSLEADKIRSTSRTRSAMLAALQAQPLVTRELWGGSAVQTLDLSPDRSRVVAGLRDGSVRAWEIATGRAVFGPTMVEGEPRSAAFSHDGERVAVGTTKGEIVILDADTGDQVDSHVGDHEGSVRALDYSRDGKWLASGGDEGDVLLRPTAAGGAAIQLEGHRDWVTTVAFSPDSETLFTGAGRSTGTSEDQRILAWPVDSPSNPTTVGEHAKATRALVVSDTGHLLASVGADGLVILWDLTTGRKQVLEGHSQRLYTVAISPNGKLVASAGRDYDIRVWDTETGELVHTLQGRRIAVRALAFADDSTLVSGANEATLRVWDLSGRTHPRLAVPLAGQAGGMSAAAVSRDGQVLATGTADGTVLIRDSTGESIGAEPVRLSTFPRRIALSDDGRVLATVTSEGELQLWDTKSGNSLAGPVATRDGSAVVAVSGDGRRVASGGDGKVVRIWQHSPESDRLSLLGKGSGHRSWVTGLAFHPDGQLVSSGADGLIWIWDTSTAPSLDGTMLTVIPVGQLTGITLDDDGETLAAGDYEGRVLLSRWPRDNELAPTVLDALADVGTAPSPVTAVAFSTDGKLAAMAENGAFALWETRDANPAELGRTVALGQRTFALAFTGAGDTLVTGLDSGGLMWDLHPESLRDKACEVANRNLTPAELETLLDETTYRRTCPELQDTRPIDTSEDVGSDE